MDFSDETTLPPPDFFEQHRLPEDGPPGYSPEFTKTYFIVAKGAVEDASVGLTGLIDLLFQSEVSVTPDPRGIPNSQKDWRVVLEEAFSALGDNVTNPLNIEVQAPSRVILRLIGDFWQFSRTMDPITTKADFGQQYFGMQSHGWDGEVIDSPPPGIPISAISFSTLAPHPESENVGHGFSLNVEFTSLDGKYILPITIDPDVENKGGG
ncbi:nucleotide synthetase [Sphingomonas sp. LM7]|uniref:nucleotide synthetase n=1 Tax=Sphingomonas sp. LM7 TaxID=1938607 RepID=UPI000983EFDD|nr:nucleotide synthetase [Sphingomonas sp. LM7]AQR72380.1 hypothetical protein BXU08_00690 [Sphingomonas sp. LM7]